MATTWKFADLNSIVLGKDDNVTLSIQEVIDAVPGKIYISSKFHKKYPGQTFLDDLKITINADRAKKASEGIIKGTIDLTNYEAFLNT